MNTIHRLLIEWWNLCRFWFRAVAVSGRLSSMYGQPTVHPWLSVLWLRD